MQPWLHPTRSRGAMERFGLERDHELKGWLMLFGISAMNAGRHMEVTVLREDDVLDHNGQADSAVWICNPTEH